MRHGENGWAPVGEQLPPFPHAPPRPQVPIAPWVLPRDLEPASFDVVVVGELAHQLITRCEGDDPIVMELAEQTAVLHGVEATRAWLAEVEVWLGHRLEPGRPWPVRQRPVDT